MVGGSLGDLLGELVGYLVGVGGNEPDDRGAGTRQCDAGSTGVAQDIVDGLQVGDGRSSVWLVEAVGERGA